MEKKSCARLGLQGRGPLPKLAVGGGGRKCGEEKAPACFQRCRGGAKHLSRAEREGVLGKGLSKTVWALIRPD